MSPVTVLDAAGQRLSPCSLKKARRMLAEGKATLVSENPLTIQLAYAVSRKPQIEAAPAVKPGAGKRLLLHICCGPCSTYSIRRLREQGFDVTGFWYNPNIHPFVEHERRHQCALSYAKDVGLPLIEGQAYEPLVYFDAVAGHEEREERCPICYRLRLERVAQSAQALAFDAFSTTLLISPYQQQLLIRELGEELGARYGVEFYFENLRRGWTERGRVAREHGLYQQTYCGCVYSQREAAQAMARRQADKPQK